MTIFSCKTSHSQETGAKRRSVNVEIVNPGDSASMKVRVTIVPRDAMLKKMLAYLVPQHGPHQHTIAEGSHLARSGG
jgi:hypothetical protein